MAEHVAIHLPQEVFTPKFYPPSGRRTTGTWCSTAGRAAAKACSPPSVFCTGSCPGPCATCWWCGRWPPPTGTAPTPCSARSWPSGASPSCSPAGRQTCASPAKNGNMAVFKGLDDREKLKSITFPKGELTDIWVEEASQISQADFNQLDVRLRGRAAPKQMVLTFNPISAQHWLKARFFDQLDPRALVVKSTYRDNPSWTRPTARPWRATGTPTPTTMPCTAWGSGASWASPSSTASASPSGWGSSPARSGRGTSPGRSPRAGRGTSPGRPSAFWSPPRA